MKNYLDLLRKSLLKNREVYIPENDIIDNPENIDENKKLKNIAEELSLEFTLHNLKKVPFKNDANHYNISDNMIYFYPTNDGFPTCPFYFYNNGKLVIDNSINYLQITNLDEIILQMVIIFDKAFEVGIVLDPYYFMLRLDGDVKENYKGTAKLVITDKAIRNHKLNENNFESANKHYINEFLDHFIGWNFGVSINRNETLKNELENLNNKVIESGIREYAGTGFEVCGTDEIAYNGIQHYKLSTKKNHLRRIK